ncbi:hypothetical protein ACQ4PT_042616 [Festuca glaucescens]
MEPERGKVKEDDAQSQRAARARLEEQLGKLDISEVEATPLVLDDREEGEKKWLLAGKRDRERVWEGSPWHVSMNVVILSEFEECMKLTELRFDWLSLWARVLLNLPFNLREKKWWLPIARKIDEQVKIAQFDHAGGLLRARVTVNIADPLMRWVLIDSARRKCTDSYDIQYENVPHFCFSCGRFGHGDLVCTTPGTRDNNGALPFGKSLRAPDERRRSSHGEASNGEQSYTPNNKAETRGSSTNGGKGVEVTSPLKKNSQTKRKAGVPNQVYRRVETPLLLTNSPTSGEGHLSSGLGGRVEGGSDERDPKKKKPTPPRSTNTADVVLQPCREQ